MERLTRRYGNGIKLHKFGIDCFVNCDNCSVGSYNCEDARDMVIRLADIEDILGTDYDLNRLRELVEADRDGRCVVLPCKIGDPVYSIRHHLVPDDRYRTSFHEELMVIEQKFGLIHADCVGKTVFPTREAAEAALKKEE